MTPANPMLLLDAQTATVEFPSAETIADTFELLARERAWLDRELFEITDSRPTLSRTTIDRIVALGQRLTPAALVHDRLTALDPAALQAG